MPSLFDLHCDTPTESYARSVSIADPSLMASAAKADDLDRYVQVAAIWSDYRLNDEDAYQRYLAVRDNFTAQTQALKLPLIKSGEELATLARGYILAVEDARILGGDLTRLAGLYEDGVRFLTLTWSGKSIIGGAFNTEFPLTEFGRRVVEECFRLGIIPDVSHGSDALIDEVLTMAEAAGRPVVATHSNSRAVHPHKRNLTDAQFKRIAALGGLVGISLCPPHLTDGSCTPHTVLAHMRHALALGGENVLCFGCDFDGIESTPEDLNDLSRMTRFYEFLQSEGLEKSCLDRLFYQNACDFFARVAP